MCFYITATLPKQTDLIQLREIFNKFNMSFTPIENDFIKKQLRSGDLYLRATKDYCDCDTILGALNSSEEYKKLLESEKIRRLRKKKWTEEQIEEWIQNKLGHSNPKFDKLTKLEKEQKFSRWNEFINAILSSKIEPIGLIKHWYSGDLNNAEFNIKQIKTIKMEEINEDLLLNLAEDVLYEFVD